jgi:hypothetical protein
VTGGDKSCLEAFSLLGPVAWLFVTQWPGDPAVLLRPMC